jgi:hypothetical protein
MGWIPGKFGNGFGSTHEQKLAISFPVRFFKKSNILKQQCLSVLWAVLGRFFQSLPVLCGVFNCLSFWPPGVCLHWGGSPKPQHGIFKDMIFKTWDFSFGTYTVWVSKTQTWKFFGHDFQDVGSSVFGDLEFALRVSKTQKNLGNFRIWFSGHGFQDLRSQIRGLDFHTRGFQDRNLKTFKMWFSGCGISILTHDFQDMDGEPGDFTVSEGHGHPLVK